MKNASVISPLSRSQLLDDYFNFAYKGFITLETALAMTNYLEQEDHFTVWEVVFNQMRNTLKFLEKPTWLNIFKNYLVPKLEPVLMKVGVVQNETVHFGSQEILRMKLIDWACSLGHEECSKYTDTLYQEWKGDDSKIPIHVDIQGPIFCSIVSSNGQEGFDFLWEKFTTVNILKEPALKTRLLNGLACAGEDALKKDA
jgi:hypothetical protein